MFSSGQFRVFSTEPSERALARPRHLLREGRGPEAEDAYRALIATNPDLKLAWAEYFQLLRGRRRFDEALDLAARAELQFGEDAFPVALTGAALVELGRYREGLVALEEAARRDPNLGIVWHEAGYAAYRLGEHSRALLALDRAFALEPHSGTLHLRGKILRHAGRYAAAEVAFEGAAEAAEFLEQRVEAQRQVGVTRRYAAFPGIRPDQLRPTRRWFAETGAIMLTATDDAPSPSDDALVEAFVDLAGAEAWHFTAIVRVDEWAGWTRLAEALNLQIRNTLEPDQTAIPLIVARRPHPGHGVWERGLRQVLSLARGMTLVLHQPQDQPTADIVGLLEGPNGARLDPTGAAEAVQHPESRLRMRILR
jgi:tetratricopeptide (TPR) repeat protein